MSRIVAAWAESASGPGWANAPVWVLVRERDGTLRLDCLQPSEQTHAMHLLYRVSGRCPLPGRRGGTRTAARSCVGGLVSARVGAAGCTVGRPWSARTAGRSRTAGGRSTWWAARWTGSRTRWAIGG